MGRRCFAQQLRTGKLSLEVNKSTYKGPRARKSLSAHMELSLQILRFQELFKKEKVFWMCFGFQKFRKPQVIHPQNQGITNFKPKLKELLHTGLTYRTDKVELVLLKQRWRTQSLACQPHHKTEYKETCGSTQNLTKQRSELVSILVRKLRSRSLDQGQLETNHW